MRQDIDKKLETKRWKIIRLGCILSVLKLYQGQITRSRSLKSLILVAACNAATSVSHYLVK